jgi:serine/threonine protein kinase
MPQPTQPDATLAPAGEGNAANDRNSPSVRPGKSERQDTLLLSDVPEASALMPEASAPAQPEPAPAPPAGSQPPSAPQFPTVDLTPLSQRYELLAEAGHGSMGNVYKARDRETGETVALKLLKPEIASDQAMMERFKKELLFARKITHKNVCRVHEFNRIGGIAYTSMEFVEGDSLRSVLNRFGGLPQRKALDLALQMCSALQEAHAQGIVHRDLKPENVMIDAQGNVKIMDFGIARSMDALTRLTGSMVGTPAYMAPEQVAGKPVDYRTDVYALGLILYEMFTGQPAFQAENAVAVALKQMRESPKPPHEIDPGIPFGIERAVMKCLQKDPASRFQSVAQLADALRASAAAVSSSAPTIAALTPLPGGPSRSTNRSTHSTPFAPHPLYGASAMSVPEPRKRSISGWILSLILLGGGAYAAMHWDQVKQAEREYAPLTASAAEYYYAQAKSFLHPATAQEGAQSDTRPDAQPTAQHDADSATPVETPALQSSAARPSSARHEASKSSASASAAKPEAHSATTHKALSAPTTAAPQPAGQKPDTAAPQTATNSQPAATSAKHEGAHPTAPVERRNPPTAKAGAPSAVQRRADAAFAEAGTLSVPPVNDKSPSYLWIGRFEQEDRAQVTAKKVEDLGLPVVVIPRHTERGSFYVVLSGPFGPERVGSVMEWLKEQGFPGIRVLKNPLREGRLIPGAEQDPEQ